MLYASTISLEYKIRKNSLEIELVRGQLEAKEKNAACGAEVTFDLELKKKELTRLYQSVHMSFLSPLRHREKKEYGLNLPFYIDLSMKIISREKK